MLLPRPVQVAHRHVAVLELLRDLHVPEAAVVRGLGVHLLCEPRRTVLVVSHLSGRLEVEHISDLAAACELLLIVQEILEGLDLRLVDRLLELLLFGVLRARVELDRYVR